MPYVLSMNLLEFIINCKSGKTVFYREKGTDFGQDSCLLSFKHLIASLNFITCCGAIEPNLKIEQEIQRARYLNYTCFSGFTRV